MWLLDANMDVHLAGLLQEMGLECDTAANRGWKTLTNGDLVAHAIAAGFDCLLTRDTLFGESASRALRSHPHFTVVVVTLTQYPWPQYRERFLKAWTARPIQPVTGKLVLWP
jgi:predicted nuclease of predicted toxin-antitoxin system